MFSASLGRPVFRQARRKASKMRSSTGRSGTSSARAQASVRTWLERALLSLVLFVGLAQPCQAWPQITGYAATNPRGVRIVSAPPGAPMLITGAGLGSSGSVTFNGIPAPAADSWSPTEILVTVPPAPFYPYRGPVTVSVGSDIAFGTEFTITEPSAPISPSASARPPVADGRIQVTNLSSGDILRYPVALLRGTVADRSTGLIVEGSANGLIQVTNTSSPRLNRVTTGRVYRGQFKALVELVPGSNQINLETGDGSAATLTLTYQPMTTWYVVRVIYLTDNTGSTTYQTQKADDPQDYAAKLDTALKLAQTFTAESLNDKGFGRKTFRLELDLEGRVIIHNVRAPDSAAYYQSRTENQLYDEFYDWIDQQFPMATGKDLVVLAFTHYDPVRKKWLGDASLGGGGMALRGKVILFTCPSSLQDVPRAFSDATRVDPQIGQDASGRNTLWSLASSNVGVQLHEVAHTFDLDHSSDPLSIMYGGWMLFSRMFTVLEAPSALNAQPRRVNEREVPYFDRSRAAHLASHRWFQPD